MIVDDTDCIIRKHDSRFDRSIDTVSRNRVCLANDLLSWYNLKRVSCRDEINVTNRIVISFRFIKSSNDQMIREIILDTTLADFHKIQRNDMSLSRKFALSIDQTPILVNYFILFNYYDIWIYHCPSVQIFQNEITFSHESMYSEQA